MVSGTREHAAAVLAPMGLRLSADKTKITHIDKGLDFLGWHIQRHHERGTSRHYVHTYPSRKAVKAVTAKVKAISRRNINQPLQTLLRQLNPARRGWCAYFRPGVSAATFSDLARYTLGRFLRWARRKHRRITMVAGHHRDRAVQPRQDTHHALPLPRSRHPGTVASQRMTHHGNPNGTGPDMINAVSAPWKYTAGILGQCLPAPACAALRG